MASLTSRSWLDAIKAENLPDVPPGLDVYRYACLMLDRDCQLWCAQPPPVTIKGLTSRSGQINSGTHDFALMLRICTRCRKEQYVTFYRCLVYHAHMGSSYVHDSTPKMSALATDIKACLRSTHNGPVAGGRWRVRRQWWLLKDVEVLLEAMPDDDDINGKVAFLDSRARDAVSDSTLRSSPELGYRQS